MRVVIVGGGLIGLGIALEALGRGCEVEVVDDNRDSAAYRASAGMLALPSEAQTIEAKLVELARESHRLYPDFIDRIERASGTPCNLSSVGSLYVALHRDDVAVMDHLAQAQARLGISAERLSGQEIREREPLLSPGVLGGLYAKERQIDPRRLHAALRAAVERLGGPVHTGEVTSLLRSGDSIDGVELQRGAERHRLECDHTVIAAGAWARKLLSPILGEIPLRPVKGLTLRLRGGRLLQHVVRSPDVYLVPMADNELLIGASIEEVGFDASINFGELTTLALCATRVLPGVKELSFREASIGFRPVLRDGLPALGPTRARRLHLAIGHSRHGVSLLPATASVVADALFDGVIASRYRELSSHRLEE